MSEPASSKSVNSKSVISKPEADAFTYARRFQDLRVYKKCRVLAKEVFVATKKSFPSDEKFCSQTRSAALRAQLAASSPRHGPSAATPLIL
jgi:hypothetical protein